MFGGIIPKARVKSSMAGKDVEGTSYSVQANVANTGRGLTGFVEALKAGGGRGKESYKEGALTFSDSANVLPSEAESVCEFIHSVAVSGPANAQTGVSESGTSAKPRKNRREPAETNGTTA